MAGNLKKKYTKELKQEAVNLAEKQGYSNTEAARSLGVSESAIRGWKKQFCSDHADKTLSHGTEIKRLKKENERLRMEREILKKAVVFFARETL